MMLRRTWQSPDGRAGLLILAILLLLVASGTVLDASRLDILHRFAAPGLLHPLGTDALGRDILARLAQGGGVALGLAVLTTTLALAAGVLLGVVAARGPSWLGRLVLVLLDTIGAFPSLLLALASVALLGPGIPILVLVVALGLVPQFGRLARAQALALSRAPFLEAANAIGTGPVRILWRHILPNIAGPLLVLACLDVPVVIAIEAGMSFLGVGVPPPAPSWGGMLFEAYVGLDQSPWQAIAVCLALILATLGFTLMGEALQRDATPDGG